MVQSEQNHQRILYLGAQDQQTTMVPWTTMVPSEYNHQHILYKGAQDQHDAQEHTTIVSCTKVHETNTTTIVYKSTTPAHLDHFDVPEQSHQHHGVQSAQEPNPHMNTSVCPIAYSFLEQQWTHSEAQAKHKQTHIGFKRAQPLSTRHALTNLSTASVMG